MKQLSILKVEPINFTIRNQQEKDLVISTFQKFLNSLSFPIQIVVATDMLNLDHYLTILEEKAEEVSKKTNHDYSKLCADFKAHLQSMISAKGLLNRSFYLVIPEKQEIGIEIQVQVCEQLLKNMNLRCTLLKDDELKYAVKGFFNDVYAEEKKDTPNTSLFHEIAPQQIINTPTELHINDTFVRTIAVKGYPRTVEEGFLDKIITLNGALDLSLHIEPYNIELMMVMLNKELQKQRGDLWSLERKGMINPTLEIQYQDTRNVLDNVQKGNEKLFNVSLYIACKAKTLEELNTLTKKVESELNALLLVPTHPRYVQHRAYKAVIPLGMDELKIKRNVTTKALSAFFPFTSQFLQVDESGVLLGLNRNNIPIIKDLFKLYNANGVVLASSGGGKSYFTKLLISRLLLSGTKVMVVDPQSEYVELVERFQGQVITISRTSETIINPLDLMGHEYDEKKLTLLDLFPIMLGQTSEIQRAVLDRALTTIYNTKGITNEKSTWTNEPPILGDLLQELKRMSRDATMVEKETYRSLINRIEMYVTGVFSFLNRQTNLNFQNRFVCFNIGDMPNQVKPAVMFLILDYVYMKMKKDIERKILVIDEAWSLLERTEDESYIFKIVKTCRKFNLGLLLITQDVGDLLKNDAGKALLNNSEYTLLLRQKPSIIEQVQKTFQLSAQERERLLTAQTGEGIIIISNEHSEIKVIASPEEHQVITTNADERLAKELAKANDIVTEFRKSTLEYEKGFFKKKELTQDEVDELLKHGYHLSSHIGLFGGRQEDYVLKPRSNESAEHFFVIKAIEEYLCKNGITPTLYETKEPDIVFMMGNRKIAIEVETGTLYDKAKSQLKTKVQVLNKKYGNDWFFVITSYEERKNYEELGKTYLRKEVPAVLKKECFLQSSNFGVISANDHNNSRFKVQTDPCINPDSVEPLNPDAKIVIDEQPMEAHENGKRQQK